MNGTIILLTLRQVLGRRRSLLMVFGALVPVLIAVLFAVNASGDDPTPEHFTATALLGTFVINAVLPIVALVFGTSVLGGEIDEGTAVYLLSKPISRARIVLSKLVVACIATIVVVVPSAAIAGLVALEGKDSDGIVPAFAVAMCFGALAYSCVFVLLSIVTSRALIAGLIYVFIWEGVVTNLFSGTRLLSIREFTLAIADGLTRVRASDFEANLAPAQGLLLTAAVVIAATVYAIRRLEVFEIGETT
ncbi:MAG TPA: ABC transporter permease subunit [Solirubrobacterales bacterium]|nr:ABC transporter permease subunit [Solirubrobacterales bacterium]